MSSSIVRQDGGAAIDVGNTDGPESRGTSLRRLTDILQALPSAELESLISRMGIRIDASKRIDPPAQVARALVALPDVRDPIRLPAASRELMYRIAEAGGLLRVPTLPAGLDTLVHRGMVFGRKGSRGFELVLPTAFLLQLKSWEGEDPRSLRALIAQAPVETTSAIASHYLGRPATPPIALSLEAAWESLCDPFRTSSELERLPPLERRLLESIEAVGGEVDTQELLDLEREPMRLRGAGGITASRRGAGFSLERRAFLIPIHPNRHVIPTEIARIVGADRHRVRETRRAEIRSFVIEEDHAPRRAKFTADPAMLALAMALAVRDPGSEVRAGVGTPRSLLVRLSQRFGRDIETVGLLAALSRAIGLWEPSAATTATPPGNLQLQALTPLLFHTWRRGGAWDEARPEREALRVPEGARDASPSGVLREIVLDALQDLGEGRWVPWKALSGYLAADARIPGVERLLRRWAERAGVEPPNVLDVTRHIALETLPALGIVDLGGAEDADGEGGIALRLTPRGRVLLSGGTPAFDASPSKFVDAHDLRAGPTAVVASILGVAPFVEIGRVDDGLHLLITPPALQKALTAGLDADTARARIEAIAPLSDALARTLMQASVIVGRGTFVAASGFLWIEDSEVREMLRTRRPVSELFVDPSPPAGLLIAPEIDADRLVRRCRALGIEIEIEGAVMRARLNPTAPPPRTMSQTQMEAVKGPGATRSRGKPPYLRGR
ncbi:MAG: hypothetical protein IPK82_25175 [Polyangiaceae bacterium]|nr:hypothetical protein [Polyangiaceae bacterium]